MTPCQFKRGFFTFRTCDRTAVKQCESCGLSACPFHLSVQSGMRFCVDCAAGQNTNETGEDFENDNWVYSERHSYYSSGYRPFMYGSQDYRSFDSHADETDNFDDDPYAAGGDFSDS
jgi:hypothetical protein